VSRGEATGARAVGAICRSTRERLGSRSRDGYVEERERVCVCVRERDRERDKEREIKRERERERERER
jgi:hypothetical protein